MFHKYHLQEKTSNSQNKATSNGILAPGVTEKTIAGGFIVAIRGSPLQVVICRTHDILVAAGRAPEENHSSPNQPASWREGAGGEQWQSSQPADWRKCPPEYGSRSIRGKCPPEYGNPASPPIRGKRPSECGSPASPPIRGKRWLKYGSPSDNGKKGRNFFHKAYGARKNSHG